LWRTAFRREGFSSGEYRHWQWKDANTPVCQAIVTVARVASALSTNVNKRGLLAPSAAKSFVLWETAPELPLLLLSNESNHSSIHGPALDH
jgi:hypothetical protein